MNEEQKWNRAPAAVVPLPKPVGFWRRMHMLVLGFRDRFRYRDAVKDGQHTHLSRWIEATANRGISRVDTWERGNLAPIETELAALPAEPPFTVATEAGIAPPTEPREHVRWNEQQRVRAAAAREASAAAANWKESQDRRRVLESTHRSVRLDAANARERWVSGYLERVEVYSLHRISRRGLRPAAQATAPEFASLDERRIPSTNPSGARTFAGE